MYFCTIINETNFLNHGTYPRSNSPIKSFKMTIRNLISLGKTEEALELIARGNSDAEIFQERFYVARQQYNLGMIDFSEWTSTQAQIDYAALQMMNIDIDHPISAGEIQTEVDSTPTLNFSDVQIGDQVYVEPLGSGPYSGEGWETVTKVKTGDKSVVFKTESQWFFQDGSPKTAPFGYGVSQLKTKSKS